MGTLCRIIKRFNWLNREHPGGFAATRPATSGKVRLADSDAIWAIPDASCAPKMRQPLLLDAAKATRIFVCPHLETDRNRPLVIPAIWRKSSRDLVEF